MLFLLIQIIGCSSQKEDWKTAKDENNINSYEKFLKLHTTGIYADSARSILETLYRNQKYTQSRNLGTIAAYEDFLKYYPVGEQSDSVRIFLENLYFHEASTINTYISYRDFLDRYKTGVLSEKALILMSKLKNERKRELRNIETIKIIVNESYGKAKNVSLPFYDVAYRLAKYANLQVVDSDAKKYDAILQIKAVGEAIGTRYYSAALSGNIIFKSKISNLSITKSFTSYIPYGDVDTIWKKGDKIIDDGTGPSNARFGLAFNAFKVRIIETFDQLFGRHCLISALYNKDQFESFLGRSALEIIENKRDFNALKIAVYHPDITIARRAVESLGKMRKKSFNFLISLLNDNNSEIRWLATIGLGNTHDKRAFNYLNKALQDENSSVRNDALWAIKNIPMSPMNGLIKALENENPEIKRFAIHQLGQFEKPKSKAALINFVLYDSSYSFYNEIVEVLEAFEKIPIDSLSAILKSNNHNLGIRIRAANLISISNNQGVAKPLFDALCANTEPLIEDKILESLKKLTNIVIELLISELNSKEIYVRKKAAYSLGYLEDPRAIKPLINVLNSKNDSLNTITLNALEKITGIRIGNNYEECNDWWSMNRNEYLVFIWPLKLGNKWHFGNDQGLKIVSMDTIVYNNQPLFVSKIIWNFESPRFERTLELTNKDDGLYLLKNGKLKLLLKYPVKSGQYWRNPFKKGIIKCATTNKKVNTAKGYFDCILYHFFYEDSRLTMDGYEKYLQLYEEWYLSIGNGPVAFNIKEPWYSDHETFLTGIELNKSHITMKR